MAGGSQEADALLLDASGAATVAASSAAAAPAASGSAPAAAPAATATAVGPDAEPAPTWVPWQRAWGQAALLGLVSGLLAAWVLAEVAAVDAGLAGAATVVGFGVSASLLALLVVGVSVPVTHHMTLPAGVAASLVIASGGSMLGALAVGATTDFVRGARGVLGALLGELAARTFLIHGDTHIDPPAIAIALMTTAIVLTDLAL
jgi:hypothetical protein